jgi:gliding motility-associated-like protein
MVMNTSNGCFTTAIVSVSQNIINPTITVVPSSATINIGENVTLNASGGISYTWVPSTGLDNPNIANPTASPSVETIYCVWGENNLGCKDSSCVRIYINDKCLTREIFVPNVFSPNGDGKNDEFCVMSGECLSEFIIRVYDRWGEKVFESSDYTQCWDGNYKGGKANSGVYVYYLSGKTKDGKNINQKGNLTLLR